MAWSSVLFCLCVKSSDGLKNAFPLLACVTACVEGDVCGGLSVLRHHDVIHVICIEIFTTRKTSQRTPRYETLSRIKSLGSLTNRIAINDCNIRISYQV